MRVYKNNAIRKCSYNYPCTFGWVSFCSNHECNRCKLASNFDVTYKKDIKDIPFYEIKNGIGILLIEE